MSRCERRQAQIDYAVWCKSERDPCDVKHDKYIAVRAAIDAIKKDSREE